MQRRAFLGVMLGSAISATAAIQKPDNSIWIVDNEVEVFLSVCKKVELVKKAVGYGNFNILSFDDMLKIAKRYSWIGKFTDSEITFMEKMFYENPAKYGFYGKAHSSNSHN